MSALQDILTQAMQRSLGMVPRDQKMWDARNDDYPILRALLQTESPVSLDDPRVPVSRLWYLRRDGQEDQGQTPWCVAATGKHWEKSWPVGQQSGMTMAELYLLLKQNDGYPHLDGSDGHALVKVYKSRGMIENYFWYAGNLDALKLWVLVHGSATFGAYWSESMFFPRSGILTVTGALQYGHETLINGYNRKTDLWTITNSWGREWGVDGRAQISSYDLQRLLAEGGDACVMVQRRLTLVQRVMAWVATRFS